MKAGDVLISVDPCVSGTRSAGYSGVIRLERNVSGVSWEEAIGRILEDAAEEARHRSCNAVVNVEIHCDPYRTDGVHVSLTGTMANLEPLFAGMPLEVAAS